MQPHQLALPRAQRLAVATMFAVNGIIIGSFASRIPAIKDGHDLSEGMLGLALLAVAAGAVLAVVSIAIIPHAFQQVSSLVASATVLGFVTGYLLS